MADSSNRTNNVRAVSAQDIDQARTVVDSSPRQSGDGECCRERLRNLLGRQNVDSIECFEEVTTIAVGGTGTVLSAREPILGREVAIKILRPEHRSSRQALNRFVKEARATAQIEHPSIVPIHSLGYMEDMGPFFTMKKVSGKNLQEILDALKRGDPVESSTCSLSRLLEIFIRVCQGVSYAHSRGIIHRDLKPENIIVGDYGEVLVVDWGLVKYLESNEDEGFPAEEGGSRAGEDRLNFDRALCGTRTIEGSISGTPSFMSPEQARGDLARVGRHSDIYSLGCILYQILTCEFAFEAKTVGETLSRVLAGSFVPPRIRAPHRKVPRELEAVCLKAMNLDIEDRYSSTQELIQDIRNFLENIPVSAYRYPLHVRFFKWTARHRVLSVAIAAMFLALGMTMVALKAVAYTRFRTIMDTADRMKLEGHTDFQKLEEVYRELEALQKTLRMKEKTPEEEELESHLARLRSSSENRYNAAIILYSGVPTVYQDDPAILGAFREIMGNRIRFSIATGDYKDMTHWKEFLQILFTPGIEQGTPFPHEAESAIDELRESIRGDGRLTIRIEPMPERLSLYALEADGNGVLVPHRVASHEQFPVENIPIPKGSYLAVVSKQGDRDVPVPVLVGHAESVVLDVKIPATIPDDMAFIPAGPFLVGGSQSRLYRRYRTTLPDFLIKTHEVTFDEYIEFWKTLPNPDHKARYLPKILLDTDDACFLGPWGDNGVLVPPFKGDRPVIGLSREAVNAYCSWISTRLGAVCRLPTSEEWEKAARGVDGRLYPWGDGARTEYAYIVENREARSKYGDWAPVGSFPVDRSVYGLFDLGGNVREMTSSLFPGDALLYQIKGASSSTTMRFLYCEGVSDTPSIPTDVGFRYVMEVEKTE